VKRFKLEVLTYWKFYLLDRICVIG